MSTASSSRLSTPKPSLLSSTIKTSSHSHTHANHAAYNLISRAHPNDADLTNSIFTEKILHKPLLLSSSHTTNPNPRSLRRHIRLRKRAYALRHARPRPLSAKEKRALKIYELRPEECRYEVYRGLNALWRRYILEVLGYLDRDGNVVEARVGQPVAASSSGASALASADFHGMEVEVVACVDPGRVGCKGIVVRETRSTLTVVCDEKEESRRKLKAPKKRKIDGSEYVNAADEADDNGAGAGESGLGNRDLETERRDKVRMILKKGAVFRVTIDLPTKSDSRSDRVQKQAGQSQDTTDGLSVAMMNMNSHQKRQLVFELHGDQLEMRPIERAVKKFKWKPADYL